jgi:hypothetical protein
MALLSLFKKTQGEVVSSSFASETNLELEDFRFFYLYGISNNPNRTSGDVQAFNNLYQMVIGRVGGVCIANALHPYFTINSKGLTVWTDAFIKMAVNKNKEEMFGSIKNERAVYTMGASSTFKEMQVWPDSRLSFEENPGFSKYVPFIIPFLALKSEQSTNWDTAISTSKITNGYATEYLEEVTNAIRFFMPAPAFVLGFDEFDGTNPSGLIDKFVACKSMLGML